jgi:hypothetical protein
MDVTVELRIRAVRLTKRTAAIVAYGAQSGDWLLELPEGEFRVCSNKTFRRDFPKRLKGRSR